MESNREVLPTSADRKLIEEKDANIYAMPKARKDAKGTAILGDLHGNAIKLLYFLIREGILELDTNPAKYPKELKKKIPRNPEKLYQILVKIYEKDPDVNNNSIRQVLAGIDNITDHKFKVEKNYFAKVTSQLEKEDLVLFKEIIANARIVKKRKIILIGDEFSDRGNNDYFTLKIIEKLKNECVPYEILLSNHGAEFYAVFQDQYSAVSQESNQAELKRNNITRCTIPRIGMVPDNDQTLSLQNLGALINRNLVSLYEIKDLINTCCTPYLKLISYVETQDKLGICSHAPIGFETIQGFVKALGLASSFDVLKTKDIKKIIEEINEKSQSIMSRFKLCSILPIIAKAEEYYNDNRKLEIIENVLKMRHASDLSFFENQNIKLTEFIFYLCKIIWNRDRRDLLRTLEQCLWINGHDQLPLQYKGEICLDNNCGKKLSHRYHIVTLMRNIKQDLEDLDTINGRSQSKILNIGDYMLIADFCTSFLYDPLLSAKDKSKITLLLMHIEKKPNYISNEAITLLKHLANTKMTTLASGIATGKLWPKFYCNLGPYFILDVNEKIADLKLEGETSLKVNKNNNNNSPSLFYLWANQMPKPNFENDSPVSQRKFRNG